MSHSKLGKPDATGSKAAARLAVTPADQWLASGFWLRDPFPWRKESKYVASGPELVATDIAEQSKADPNFPKLARAAALRALESSNPAIVCRGLRVLAVVADTGDIERIRSLTSSPEQRVAGDARTCLFHLGFHGRAGDGNERQPAS